MDSNFYDFLVANSMSELLRKGEELITSSGLINDIDQLKGPCTKGIYTYTKR